MSSQGLETLITFFFPFADILNKWSKMLNNFFKVGEVVLLCILWKTHIAILVSGCFGDLWLIYIKGCWYPDALTYCLWTFRLSCVFPMWALFTDASLDDATLCKMLPIGGENIFCILLITNHCAEWIIFEGLLGKFVHSASVQDTRTILALLGLLASTDPLSHCFTRVVLFSFLHNMAANRLSPSFLFMTIYWTASHLLTR